MSAPRLERVVVGVESVADAARTFAERLELPGRAEGDACAIPIGQATIELSARAQPAGLARLVLRSEDLAELAKRLEARGVPFERAPSGALLLAGEATHGVAIEIRGPGTP